MPKVIRVTSTFPADAQAVWGKLQDIETLRFITRPMMTFTPAAGTASAAWHEGGTYAFRLRVFGVIPFGGGHVIHVESKDPACLTIRTRERSKVVRTWKHRIELVPQQRGTRYTDTVEIDAGLFTPLVTLWSHAFYRHRQKRWLKLLKEMPQ